MKPRTLILLYHYAAGLCDTSTGLLLLFAPAFTLRLMGVTRQPQPLFYASYIGVFVLCVGASYLVVPGTALARAVGGTCWRTQWLLTALFRSAIAMFVIAQVAIHAMQPAWLGVAATDGAFAAIQWVGLRKDWITLAE
ncbi:MAG: hypothetical protein ACP5M4_00445 [Acidobacteriaceae bacterium]